MPFGLKNVLEIFQKLVNSVLQLFLDNFVFICLDDILVFSNSDEELQEHLRLVFEVLHKYKTICSTFKSAPSTNLQRHLVEQGVVKVLQSKVNVMY